MNMSLVLRLPRKMHLCRSSSNVPRLPSFLEMLQNITKPSRFAHFWQGAQSLAPATQKRRFNVQKWREHVVFCAFWLRNLLCATTMCNFSSLIWPAGSAPATLASVFSLEKHTWLSYHFSRTWIFFLLRRSLFWSVFFFSSLLWLFPSLLFICPYCRKFDF